MTSNGASSTSCHVPPTPTTAPTFGANSFLLLSTPRKVSFEDSRKNSDSSLSKQSSHDGGEEVSSTQPQQPLEGPRTAPAPRSTMMTEHPLRKNKRTLLVRPATSLSLVDLLAQSTQSEGETTAEGGDVSSLSDEEGGRKAKRICSPLSSPRHGCSSMESGLARPISPHAATVASSATPWGHFVEMVTPEEAESSSTNIATVHPYYHYPQSNHTTECCCGCASQSSSFRSRRQSPYGKFYKNNTAARTRRVPPPPSFLQLQDSTLEPNTTTTVFRLQPRTNRRRDTTEQLLVGAFSDLNF